MTDKTRIIDFLKTQPMATISTIAADSSQPESALIAFTQTDDLEIIFETFVDTRKWNNLMSNPCVALVIGWDPEKHVTVQYEGLATAIPDSKIEYYTKIFLKKDTPCTETFLRDPRVRLFKVAPKWIRYSDYTSEQPRITEANF